MVLERATLSSVHQRLRRGQPRPRVNIDKIAAPVPALQLLYPLLLLGRRLLGRALLPFPHSRLLAALAWPSPRPPLPEPADQIFAKVGPPRGRESGRDIYIKSVCYKVAPRDPPYVSSISPGDWVLSL